MDEQQDKAFKEAVERKKADAKAKSEQTSHDHVPPEGEELPIQQDSLIADGTPPDVQSPRDHNTRHGKVTADKWNQ
jgi:hypothetical protein